MNNKKIVIDKATQEKFVVEDSKVKSYVKDSAYVVINSESESPEGHEGIYNAKRHFLRSYNEMMKYHRTMEKYTRLYTPLEAEYTVTVPFLLKDRAFSFSATVMANSQLEAYTQVYNVIMEEYKGKDLKLSPFPKDNVSFIVHKEKTDEDLLNMLYLIGYDEAKIEEGKFYPDRNCFFTKEFSSDYDKLFVLGFVSKQLLPISKEWYYQLTEEGLKYIERELNILIARCDE